VAEALLVRSFTDREGASTLLRLAGRPEERIEVCLAGGRGGGAILVLVVLGDAVLGAGTGVLLWDAEPGLGIRGSGEATTGTGL
jgi:hypothetical protein